MVAIMSDQGTFVRLSRFANGTYRVCLVNRDGDNEFVIAQGNNQEEVCEQAQQEFARAAEIPKLLRLEG